MKTGCVIAFFFLATSLSAQRIAMIQPEAEQPINGLASALRSRLTDKLRFVDDALADSAYRSVALDDPYNLSREESRRIGSVMGTSDFIILRSGVQRRASLGGPGYFEAYAAVYLVSARSGSLTYWKLESERAETESVAQTRLMASVPKMADQITAALAARVSPPDRDPRFIPVPPEGSALAKGLRTPVPYRRLRPAYTELASSYGIRATIDIEVDIESDGTVASTSIERWAGFGLEESVEKAVRSMNWRPAERDGRSLPMRILLRYNFTKIEKDEAN